MPTPVEKHRSNLKKRGIVRLEVQVRALDASLMRSVAKKLTAGPGDDRLRNLLRNETHADGDLAKELLASAPLEGVVLKRSRDKGRKVKL